VHVVVVLAHPDPHSFTHAVAATATDALQRAGHQVVVHDLYAEGFRAAMSAEERRAYHGGHPVIDPLVRTHVDDVRAAQALVFVYPTWWSTLPAILKGWLERVMVPGVGFVFDSSGKVSPGMRHVKRLVGISTYGSPRPAIWLTNDNGRRTLLRGLRGSTGLRVRTRWLALHGVDGSTAEQRGAFLGRVSSTMERL
jgi:putative NADPH-quinone reductase